MSGGESPTPGSAEGLRRAFDLSFSKAVHVESTRYEDLLAIGVGGEPYALRVSEITGLFADKVITALPTSAHELVGIAGFRGAIVPVFDLGALLGCAKSSTPRWLVLASSGATGAAVALAFDEVGSYLRLGPQAFARDNGTTAKLKHVREVAQTDAGARPIIHVPSVLEAVERQAHHAV